MLYRATQPHRGFALLRGVAATMPRGGFVFTSNVDGQFQRAGFPEERVVECHGSIHYLQCLERCTDAIWSADGFEPVVDAVACRMTSALPKCPNCGALARPAILMFSDWDWAEGRMRVQAARLSEWRRRAEHPVVVEIGAGGSIPTVRAFAHQQNCPLIRINPTEWQVPRPTDIGIATGALAGISGICRALGHEEVPHNG